MSTVFLSLVEQRRTGAELNAVLSAYLSDGILGDVHDWGTGHNILVVVQREAQHPGMWRLRWLYPLDNRLKFHASSMVTRVSFTLTNALPSELRPILHLPGEARAIAVIRSELERATSTGELERRFPNSLGYIAVSRAGFNFNKTEAIFYLDHFCGLCGGGRYILMRKASGAWKVADEHYTWIS